MMARYRPYVVAVVAVAVIVLPFGRDGDSPTVARAGPSSAATASAAVGSAVPGADPSRSARISPVSDRRDPRGSEGEGRRAQLSVLNNRIGR